MMNSTNYIPGSNMPSPAPISRRLKGLLLVKFSCGDLESGASVGSPSSVYFWES